MDRFPAELIYVLVFAGIALMQYLLKRFVPTQPPTPASEPLPEQRQVPAQLRLRALERDRQVKAHKRSNAVRDPRVQVPVPTPAPKPPAYPRSEHPRFSKRSLLGSRRQVQNAIVLATILGPCRALESRG